MTLSGAGDRLRPQRAPSERNPMTLAERLSEYIQACFSGIWVESHEHEDALAEIAQLCCRENWRLAVWDLEQGLQVRGAAAGGSSGGGDPLAAIRALAGLVPPLPPKADDDEEQ